MLEIFVIAYCLYFAFNTYTSFMQIGYVKDAKKLKPIILDSRKYEEAANYSIEKEKMAIVSSFYDFILFILWIGFGLSFLDSIIQIDSMLLKAVVFVNSFIIINLHSNLNVYIRLCRKIIFIIFLFLSFVGSPFS